MVVFDGLRPEQMTPQDMPHLWRLARRGVCFLQHHATFPTETRVNVASFMTGCYPGRHGLVGNQFYLHAKGARWRIDTGNRQSVATLEAVTDGHALQRQSLGEILGSMGERMACINVGTSGNAYLNHHKAAETNGLIIHPQFTIPTVEAEALRSRVGAWPPTGIPNAARIHHAANILLDDVIPRYKPTVAVLWLSDPDSTQHKTGISSIQALAAIRHTDEALGRITKKLEAKGLAASTDVLVASDHGHSTVTHTVDVTAKLITAGLKESLESPDVLLTGAGGCVLLYVQDHDPSKVAAIAEFLARQTWCGPLFTSSATDPVSIAFPLQLIHSQTPRSPDILMSFTWTPTSNRSGLPGGGPFNHGSVEPGGGNHGSISPFEIHSVLVATGPHFKHGMTSTIPSGNVDLLPTILHLLGRTPPATVDGRVLREALADGPPPEDTAVKTHIHEVEDPTRIPYFKQRLQTSTVAQTSYLETGQVIREENRTA